MPLSFMNQQVTVIRPQTVEKRGVAVTTWDGAPTHTLERCQVTGSTTSREFEGRVVQVSDRKTLRALYDADVQPGDRIVVDGVTYEIDGEVVKTASPTGRVSSTRCQLVRWKG